MINNLNLGKKIIKDKIPLLPKNPGVYRMLSSKKEILYIGKAKNIPNRLRSYVTDGNLPIRTERMLSQNKYLETTTTSNESEALLLEANLIKKFKPRFNILLKDDKSFPYIFLSEHDFPRIEKHRGVKNRPGRYFGPFASAMAVNSAIKTLQKIFLIRSCTDQHVSLANKTCFNYYLKRCAGPCGAKINKEDYAKLVEAADEFLSSGKYRKIQKSLSTQMDKASDELDFEKAATYRDKIKSLNIIQSSLKISETNLVEADVIAGYKESGKTCVQVFFFRSKQNWGNQAFFPKHDPEEELSNVLSSFIAQFYENKSIPSLIITSHKINEKKLLEKTFSIKENKEIILKEANKKEERSLTTMAGKNAKQALTQKLYEAQSNLGLIDRLSKKFKLINNINLIEVYDNSHIQGTDCVGALIAFNSQGFVKKRYRKFNIKNDAVKGDDYGMLKEVLFRRFSKAIKEKSTALSLPDLVMIDGGKGQYSVSREVLDKLKLHDMPIIAIAKGKNRHAGNETIYFQNKEYNFEKNDSLLFFIQRLRDEAHRFAITHHRNIRSNDSITSILDDVPGIGPKNKTLLLTEFKTLSEIRKASIQLLTNAIGKKLALNVHNYLNKKKAAN